MAEPIIKVTGALGATKDLLASLGSIVALATAVRNRDSQPWRATRQKMEGFGTDALIAAGYGVEASGGDTADENAARLLAETEALDGMLTNDATTLGDFLAQALKVSGMIVVT